MKLILLEGLYSTRISTQLKGTYTYDVCSWRGKGVPNKQMWYWRLSEFYTENQCRQRGEGDQKISTFADVLCV